MIADSRIRIDLTWTPTRLVESVQLSSTRNTGACRVFEGKPVSEALQLVPLLFGICGRAQAIAGLSAVEHAQRLNIDGPQRRVRAWVVRLEAVQEYLWRLLIDLPRLFGIEPAMSTFAPLRLYLQQTLAGLTTGNGWVRPGGELPEPDSNRRERVSAGLSACLEQEVLGIPLNRWDALESSTHLESWLQDAATPVAAALRQLRRHPLTATPRVDCLPAVGHSDWVGEIDAELAALPRFANEPLWRGRHCETGALARCRHRPLIETLLDAGEDLRLVRLVARVMELVDAARWLAANAGPSDIDAGFGGAARGSGAGYGWVETARGLLVHHVELDGASVAAYRILAPTEWNFHPDGPLIRELSGLTARDDAGLRRQVESSVLALDPCVAFEVRVSHA